MSSRREFVSAGLLGLTRKSENPIAGRFVNESHQLGHALRDGSLQSKPREVHRVPIVIVGGGIAGLSAAWRLHKRGFRDFVLLEMESQPGGNSRWGECETTAHPWAAHYIPVPGSSLTLVRELMQDLGVLREGKWQERWLCHSPQERVFVHGRWQEGFEPRTRAEREEWNRFESAMAQFSSSGEFTIPKPRRPRLAHLNRLSMREWLMQNSFRSEYLHWYVDYACRDDYGAHSWNTSAWMGIHYFASRSHDEQGPLTWPEGNGWIVRRLLELVGSHVRTESPVLRITRNREVHTPAAVYKAGAVVFAAPTFLARYIIEGAPSVPIEYSPWITANVHLHRQPAQRGFEPAWDNVIVGSPSLGYVVATHMSLRTHVDRTVWTWYHALAGDTREGRAYLLRSDWRHWREFILNDLSRAHPDIRDCVSGIDLMRFGHAMARPVPGGTFNRFASHLPGVFYANSDLSGYSIFEEAQHNGVRAADQAVTRISGSR